MTAFPDAIRPQEQSERLSQTLLRSTERETLAGVEVGQLIGFRIGGPVPREPRALQRQLEASTGTVGAGDRFHALHAAVHSIIFEVGQASIQAAYHTKALRPKHSASPAHNPRPVADAQAPQHALDNLAETHFMNAHRRNSELTAIAWLHTRPIDVSLRCCDRGRRSDRGNSPSE